MSSISRQMRVSSCLIKRVQQQAGRSFTTTEGHRPTIIHKRSIDILHDPWFNRFPFFFFLRRRVTAAADIVDYADAHAIFHNLAYWIQGNVLTVEQRYTLHDVGYALMPELTGTAASASDILVFAGVFAPALLLIVSIALFRTNPEKPRYIVIVGKRLLLHISICLVFRIISFLVTTLPSPAAHCELKFNATCVAENPDDTVPCVVPNPDFNPPTTGEFFTNLDSLNGCGDLMFSSHTIYTMSFILGVWKYWPNKYGMTVMVCIQIAIAFLIVASRKHYTLDVFSALYIVPLFWFTQDAYLHDINNKDVKVSAKTIWDFYGVDISEDLGEVPTLAVPLENVQVADEDDSLTGDSEGNTTTVFQRKASM